MPGDNDALIPLTEAAVHLGLSYPTAYHRARMGDLRTTLVTNRLFVLTSEIKRYREEVLGHTGFNRSRGSRRKKPTD